MSDRTVGVIGLGIMGSAVGGNLIRDGFQVTGYDVLPDRVGALEASGGRGAASPGMLAEAVSVVITLLPSVQALEDVVFGAQGLLAANSKTYVLLECSTLPLACKERARAALDDVGVLMLDCPLSGTGAQALTKDLAVYASGDVATFERCRPIFAGFARSSHYTGPFGNGSRMKLVANLLVSIHNASAAEAFVLGMKAGLGPEMLYEVIASGAGSSRMFEVRGPMMVEGRYDRATMKVEVWRKDLEIIADFARDLDCPTPLFSLSAQLYAAALAQGRAKEDTASVCAVLEEMARLVRPGSA
ncbi:MAG: NAD(P)-dependent oxidoreductase [Geminicoccaceae bacterium]